MPKPNWKKPGLLSVHQSPFLKAELKDHNPEAPPEAKTWQEMMRALTGVDVTVCPQCGQGRLIRFQLNNGEPALAPPIWDSS